MTLSHNGVQVAVSPTGDATIKFLNDDTIAIYKADKDAWKQRFKEVIETKGYPIKSLKFICATVAHSN